jgi:hypothetical protein
MRELRHRLQHLVGTSVASSIASAKTPESHLPQLRRTHFSDRGAKAPHLAVAGDEVVHDRRPVAHVESGLGASRQCADRWVNRFHQKGARFQSRRRSGLSRSTLANVLTQYG